VLRVIVGDKKVVAFKRAREAWPPLRLVEPVVKLPVEAPKTKVTISKGFDLGVDV
jgi:hypothetical protein